MKLIKNVGMFLLGIWLILTGLLPLLRFTIPASDTVLALLAIAAGVVILLKPVKPTTKLGVLLLGVWLIATGLLPLVGVTIPATSDIILALLAIAAGIVILLGGKAPGGGG
jgi:hypothetical protein